MNNVATNGVGFNVELFQYPQGWLPIDPLPHPSRELAEVRMASILKHLPQMGELRVYEALDTSGKRANHTGFYEETA